MIEFAEIVSNRCKTVYPILLVHGVAMRDDNRKKPWGRIPKFLRQNGAGEIFFGNTDAFASIEHNAEILVRRITQILEETGAKKVNIIAHSKGGLDSRRALSSLKLQNKVASLTTVATPHHGSKSLNIYCLFPKFLQKFIAVFPNLWFRVKGDKKPDFYTVINEFSAKHSEKFNPENPDVDGVYYQSFGSSMMRFYGDFSLMIRYCIIKLVEGENDGLVAISSARWTNFTKIESPGKRGISHNQSVDRRKRCLTSKTAHGKYSDITEFYIQLAEGLKNKGL